MFHRVLVGLVVVIGVGSAGCGGKTATTCATNTDCPDGHVCLTQKCEQVCTTDQDCSAGRVCNGEICISGQGAGPTITDVTGSGDGAACQATTGKPCIGTALVVTGTHLGGSTFQLASKTGGPTYAMTILEGGRNQDTVVDLVPSASGPALVEDDYTLTAVNAAGTAQAAVNLLKGEQGIKGDKGDKGDPGTITNLTGTEVITKINDAATTGKINANRLNITGGSSGGTSSIWTDSEASTPTSTATIGNRMQVIVTASTTAVVSKLVNDTMFTALCGDEDGCTLRLGTTMWQNVDALQVSAPCHLSLHVNAGAEHWWAVSDGCFQWYGVWADTLPAGPPPGDGVPDWTNPPGFYAPYRSGAWGVDGDITGIDYDPGAATNAWVVIHNFACYLAESAATGSAARLAADNNPGFYLVASHPTWAGSYYPTTKWDSTASGRQCVLIVDD
ncbi:MAG: hypothetical protein HY903_03270 [Deltaproteobacteria bacterium]|nr:hypothetical protein [Deltaproteobacteria bacterium]